ncbi:carbonic anhydrase [Tuber brumale]|nr:carbonic anhydrase [Tuber brumale]
MADPAPPSQNIQDIVRANVEYVKNFRDEDRKLPMAPSRKLLIVTCMDARFHPISAFAPALALGSTHIVRNAGGKAADAIPSIEVSQGLGTNEILLIKHTDCGAYPDANIEQEVRQDVNFLKNHAGVKRGTRISGWVYVVTTGEAKMIEDVIPPYPPKD